MLCVIEHRKSALIPVLLFWGLVFLGYGAPSVFSQFLQYPDSSLSGDLIPLEQVVLASHSGGDSSSGKVVPTSHASAPSPRKYEAKSDSKAMPAKSLVKNVGPLVIVDSETTSLVQPVSGAAKSEESQSGLRLDFTDDSLPPLSEKQQNALRTRTEEVTKAARPTAAAPAATPRSANTANTANTASTPLNEGKSEKVLPMPTPDVHDGHGEDEIPTFRSAMFLGLAPGVSTMKEVVAKFGQPQKSAKLGLHVVHMYPIDTTNHLELTYENDTVYSVEIVFSEAYPVDQVRENFASELHNLRPVSFADEKGDVIGLVFPEKGVTLIYTPSDQAGVPSGMVNKIAILPIAAEPFVIRAKGYQEETPQDSRRDLKIAISLDDSNAEAYGLLASLEILNGDAFAAIENIDKALTINHTQPQFHITLVKGLMMLNRNEDAKSYLEEMLPLCERYQHQKAVALHLLGELHRIVARDTETAYRYHKEAMEIAIELREHANPSIREIAQEVLVDAQLGIIRDIAQGKWENKWTAIEQWFANIKEVLKDPELATNKLRIRDYLGRIARTGLSVRISVSPTTIEPYVRDVLTTHEELMSISSDPLVQRQAQWETGRVLFEAFLYYQTRKQYTQALKIGEQAVDMLELGIAERTSEEDFYLLSRVYFRMGVNHAVGMKDHKTATTWFNRTLPIFDEILTELPPENVARVGEMLVSMGVSYWETQRQEEALLLSEEGLKLIEESIELGHADAKLLYTPYSNLSEMYSKLDQPDKAEHFAREAAKIREAKAPGGVIR